MMKQFICSALFLLPSGLSATDLDTVAVKKIALEEVTVVGFKQDKLNRSPLSVSSINGRFLRENEVRGIKELSVMLPNFYMPDYGSKQGSPIYIRGVGSRRGAPSVGLYIDGVPHFENSAFDVDMSDISTVEVLRGPQGTLYGRNTIGGIINVYTRSPLDYRNTWFKVGYGSRNDVLLMASSYARLNDRLGFSVTGNYHRNDGVFTNLYTGKKADKADDVSLRTGVVWKPTDKWTARLSTAYDYTDQGGFPYGAYDVKTEKLSSVNYDSVSSYRRNLLTSGLNFRYEGEKFSFNSQTAYQYIDGKLGVDQDFTPESLYFADTRLKQNMYSQEFTFKSNNESRYRWIVGLFAFYQKVDNRVEVSFLAQGYSTPKYYDIPTTGIAFYHQSTYDIYAGLSASVGVRYDYEHASDHYAAYKHPFGGERKETQRVDSKLHFSQLTPKFSLQYIFPASSMAYASVSKGYKAGGFNVTFTQDDEFTFKPEYNWNYEIGAKAALFDSRLTAEAAIFYVDWRDQQYDQRIPRGNVTRNAGHSDSKGFECSLQGQPLRNFAVQVNYGYTYARFLSYQQNMEDAKTDYSGNFLPLVPRHTLSVNASYTLYNIGRIFDRLSFNANFTGAGPLYWNETNDVRQDFYGLLNAKVSASKGRFTCELWGKNLTDTFYLSYYTRLRAGGYAQGGKPRSAGVSLIVDL